MTNISGSSLAAFAGAPNLMLMRSESSSTDTLVAMLASCSPVHALQASRSTGSLEDAVMGCGQKRAAASYYPSFEASVDMETGEEYYGVDDCGQNVEKKRRLTFDQVRSLERNFGLENKLEPERKLQLARELGLQPRQVAVWFQNRRARCKTKQLERDYEVLTLDYNRLKTELEAVIEEKKELKAKVQWLTGKTQPEEESGCEAGDVCKVMGSTLTWHSTSSNNPLVKPEKLQLEFSNNINRDVNQPPRSTFLTTEPPLPRRRKDGSPIRSASTSSEILDADSPRTIDSGLSLITQEDHKPVTVCSQIRATNTSILDSANAVMQELTTEDVYGRVFSPQLSSYPVQRCTVNNNNNVGLKDQPGAAAAAVTTGCCFQDQDSCNYLSTQVEEHGALSWWDWPFANI